MKSESRRHSDVLYTEEYSDCISDDIELDVEVPGRLCRYDQQVRAILTAPPSNTIWKLDKTLINAPSTRSVDIPMSEVILHKYFYRLGGFRLDLGDVSSWKRFLSEVFGEGFSHFGPPSVSIRLGYSGFFVKRSLQDAVVHRSNDWWRPDEKEDLTEGCNPAKVEFFGERGVLLLEEKLNNNLEVKKPIARLGLTSKVIRHLGSLLDAESPSGSIRISKQQLEESWLYVELLLGSTFASGLLATATLPLIDVMDPLRNKYDLEFRFATSSTKASVSGVIDIMMEEEFESGLLTTLPRFDRKSFSEKSVSGRTRSMSSSKIPSTSEERPLLQMDEAMWTIRWGTTKWQKRFILGPASLEGEAESNPPHLPLGLHTAESLLAAISPITVGLDIGDKEVITFELDIDALLERRGAGLELVRPYALRMISGIGEVKVALADCDEEAARPVLDLAEMIICCTAGLEMDCSLIYWPNEHHITSNPVSKLLKLMAERQSDSPLAILRLRKDPIGWESLWVSLRDAVHYHKARCVRVTDDASVPIWDYDFDVSNLITIPCLELWTKNETQQIIIGTEVWQSGRGGWFPIRTGHRWTEMTKKFFVLEEGSMFISLILVCGERRITIADGSIQYSEIRGNEGRKEAICELHFCEADLPPHSIVFEVMDAGGVLPNDCVRFMPRSFCPQTSLALKLQISLWGVGDPKRLRSWFRNSTFPDVSVGCVLAMLEHFSTTVDDSFQSPRTVLETAAGSVLSAMALVGSALRSLGCTVAIASSLEPSKAYLLYKEPVSGDSLRLNAIFKDDRSANYGHTELEVAASQIWTEVTTKRVVVTPVNDCW